MTLYELVSFLSSVDFFHIVFLTIIYIFFQLKCSKDLNQNSETLLTAFFFFYSGNSSSYRHSLLRL